MKILLSLLSALILVMPVAADDAPRLRWSKSLQFADPGKDALVAVRLDSDIYTHTAFNYADLRVIEADGRAVPFLLRKRSVLQTRVEQRPWTTTDGEPDMKPLSEGGFDVRVKLDSKDPQPNGVRFITPLKNFEQTVTVFGTEPGKAEQELVTAARIYDYSDYMDVRRTSIVLPKNACREFRFVIAALKSDRESPLLDVSRELKGKDETLRSERTTIERRPFRIDRIEFWGDVVRESVREDATADWPISGFSASEDAEHKQTIVEFKTAREPLFQFQLRTSSRNFSRVANVQVLDSNAKSDRWRTIGSGQIHRVEFGDIKEERLTLQFPETRSETYRIVIENQDNPALTITGANAEGNDHEVIFLAETAKTFALNYGSTEIVPAPVYDTAAIRTVLSKNIEPITATAGAAIEGEVKAAPVRPKDFLNNPLLLGGIIVLLVCLLAWALFRAGQRIDQIPTAGDSGKPE